LLQLFKLFLGFDFVYSIITFTITFSFKETVVVLR